MLYGGISSLFHGVPDLCISKCFIFQTVSQGIHGVNRFIYFWHRYVLSGF